MKTSRHKNKEEAERMCGERIGERELKEFERYLRREERSTGTVEKYLRDAGRFAAWLGERLVSKENAALWKKELCALGYQAGTVNTMLSAVNRFLSFLGRGECRVRYLRIQRRIFRGADRELTRQDYSRLLETAQELGRGRLALLLETICATGIRVSEVKYITVEAARAGRSEVAMKGKIRTILLPGKLCRKLLKYAKGQKTASGEIFLTRGGRGISRRQIWAEMKALCARAGVAPSKVFPHNLRHLFARTFYKVSRDIARLADVLGHSCIETTRIYLVSTGVEHARQIERLGLLL
jgi:integrase/recombinase XerD